MKETCALNRSLLNFSLATHQTYVIKRCPIAAQGKRGQTYYYHPMPLMQNVHNIKPAICGGPDSRGTKMRSSLNYGIWGCKI